MSTLKSTVSSLFGTISETAQAASSLVNTTASGIHMINDYVSAARIKQQTSIAIDLADHKTFAIEDHAKIRVDRDTETLAWIGGDTAKADRYNKHVAELTALFSKP